MNLVFPSFVDLLETYDTDQNGGKRVLDMLFFLLPSFVAMELLDFSNLRHEVGANNIVTYVVLALCGNIDLIKVFLLSHLYVLGVSDAGLLLLETWDCLIDNLVLPLLLHLSESLVCNEGFVNLLVVQTFLNS